MNKIRANPNNPCHLRASNYGNRWQHSDIHNVAYRYTHRAFKSIVEEGGLK